MHILLRSIMSRVRPGLAAAALLLAPQSAHAQTTWNGFLLGTNEAPPNASSATGFASLTLSGNFLSIQMNFSGLTANATAGHIHCCVAPGSNIGVAVGFTGFPSGTSGTYSNTFDLTQTATYSASFLNVFGGGTAAGAQAALINGLNAGQGYVNVHNTTFPGGEIRANVTVTPEPSSVLLMGAGIVALGVFASRRRQAA